MSTRTRTGTLRLAAIVIAAASWQVAAPALAEQVIEEVVVTARKRAESAQDVPAAVSAFNSAELQERGEKHRQDLEQLGKDGDASDDDVARAEKQRDGLTQSSEAAINDALAAKEQELMEV